MQLRKNAFALKTVTTSSFLLHLLSPEVALSVKLLLLEDPSRATYRVVPVGLLREEGSRKTSMNPLLVTLHT